MTPSERYFSKVGAVAAISGLVIYGVSAYLHPWTPPHHTHEAFSDYAVESYWAVYHLGELLGILLMAAAIIALAFRLRRDVAGVWATLGGAAMMVCAGVYAIFAAVDGVALGVMVDRWAAADPEQQELLYETAFAVRQIEGGLFSIQWFMFGIAAGLFAGAFFASAESVVRLNWFSGMGWLSAVASIGALSFAIVQAHGYSDMSMAFQTGLIPGVIWVVAVGVFLYRHPEHIDTSDEVTHQADDKHRHDPAS
ncbi:hypothetical protein Htur_2077 [Haloterrigena turkmenica DSM 5511]|uniref:DUF4386 family protein n=1 Tax=Haloterrigena turkmenica (strain ATCC 51198 / DSM 5511 / JCM 9101 / NCIMB 13204 / VKM B-1734 / 4k) TaxID=543526 RepID=D2RT80_HALTV|nr:hypothetical protein [Haloterrigena turkmenica]ADB60960.1 hypothetical protein Htur_2077 [Haloterrigena turkmenica DSM 5511]